MSAIRSCTARCWFQGQPKIFLGLQKSRSDALEKPIYQNWPRKIMYPHNFGRTPRNGNEYLVKRMKDVDIFVVMGENKAKALAQSMRKRFGNEIACMKSRENVYYVGIRGKVYERI